MLFISFCGNHQHILFVFFHECHQKHIICPLLQVPPTHQKHIMCPLLWVTPTHQQHIMSPSLGATNKSYLSPPVGATNTPQTYLIRLLQWSPQTCYSSPSMGATHSFVCHQHLMTTTKTSQHPWINKALNNLIARLDQDDLCRNQLSNDSPTGDKCQPQKASSIFTWNNCRIRKRKLCAHLTPLPTGLEGSCGNCPLIQPSLGNLHAWPLHSELLGKGWAGMKRALLRNYGNVKSLCGTDYKSVERFIKC